VDPFLIGEVILVGCAFAGLVPYVLVRGLLALHGWSLRRAWRRGLQASRSARHEDAATWFRRSATIARRRFGPDDRRTLGYRSHLARALIALKRTEEAEPIVIGALAAIAKDAEVADPWLAEVELSAAALAGSRGEWPVALRHFERARAHARRNPGRVAAIDLDRGALLEHLGDRRGATEALRGVDPRFILSCYPSLAIRLAHARLEGGDATGAAALFGQLVERERRHRRDSPALAFYRGLAGEALHRAGKHAEARYALTEAIATATAGTAPEANITVAPLLVLLARTHLALHDPAAAETACRRALAIAWDARPSGVPYREPPERVSLAAVRDDAESLLSEVIGPLRAGES